MRASSVPEQEGNGTGSADGRHAVRTEGLVSHKQENGTASADGRHAVRTEGLTSHKQASSEPEQELLVTFEVCNGATNQRIALVQGLAIASIMEAKVLVPDVLSSFDDAVAKKVKFSSLFDLEYLSTSLVDTVQILGTASVASRFLNLEELQPTVTEAYNARGTAEHYRDLAEDARLSNTTLIRMDCTFNALNSLGDATAIDLLWTIEPKIRLAPKLQQIADTIIEGVRSLTPAHSFTCLHLRIEDDWIEHCRTYSSMGNCLTNEGILSSVLLAERVPTDQPLYLATAMSRQDLESDARFSKASQLQQLYHAVMKEDVVPDLFDHYSMASERDVLALIEYEVCSGSALFTGNCGSTFAGMIELRKFSPLKTTAFHYNGGPFPLARYMPVNPENSKFGDYQQYSTSKPIKWVFTMHAGMDRTAINHMKVAVQSALSNTRLLPCCIYLPPDGPTTFGPAGVELDDAEAWLLEHGVVVIRHRPKWVTNLTKAMSTFQMRPKYSETELLSLFLRVDIPLSGFVDQFVLFTEHDVVFMRDVSWADFGDEPPTHLTMGMGVDQSTDGVAGVMLLNNFKMREGHADFTRWLFEDGGLSRSLESDADDPVSAAYAYYYKIDLTKVPKAGFNWRPGWPTTRTEYMHSSIWHLHGQRFSDAAGLWNGSLDLMFSGMAGSCGGEDEACRWFMDKWKALAACTVSNTSCAPPERLADLRATAHMSMTYEL